MNVYPIDEYAPADLRELTDGPTPGAPSPEQRPRDPEGPSVSSSCGRCGLDTDEDRFCSSCGWVTAPTWTSG